MKSICKKLLGGFLLVLVVGGFASCKKRGESIHSDLGDAGYKFTAEDWFRASRENDVVVLKKFVAGGFAPDTRDASGNTALHASAQAGAEKSTDYLLGRGLAVDLRGASERTPLMLAVLANQTRMVRWLLRQGAAPRLKDKDGYTPLMLAVREGCVGPVGELSIYVREDLDAALLAAALVGKPEVMDALTKYGASVYARMDDGRTPLMLAAENGDAASVKMLVDLGSSRFTTTPEGYTAGDLANAAGHPEIAALILTKPIDSEMALESPNEIAAAMDTAMDASVVEGPAETNAVAANAGSDVNVARGNGAASGTSREVPQSLSGKTLGAPLIAGASGAAPAASGVPRAADAAGGASLVMRNYREREMPMTVKTVENDTATLRIAGASPREVQVRAGEALPGSRLVVVKVQRRISSSKDNLGKPTEVSVVGIKDTATGATRELISGVPSSAHDPLALVEDANTGKRYIASPGQRFRGADGTEYIVNDVRPNQIVIGEVVSGTVTSIPLRGPRG